MMSSLPELLHLPTPSKPTLLCTSEPPIAFVPQCTVCTKQDMLVMTLLSLWSPSVACDKLSAAMLVLYQPHVLAKCV